MQCVNSPTIKEVNNAHSKQKWLNIGTPSVRNLFFVSWSKRCLWLALGVMSFPLHMIWNSTVFETTSINEYITVAVTEEFIQGAKWSIPGYAASIGYNKRYYDIVQSLQNQATAGSLERLDTNSCLVAYHTNRVTDRKDVLLITDQQPSSETSLIAIYTSQLSFSDSYHPMYDWIDRVNGGWVTGDPFLGDTQELSAKECYSQTVDEQCKISIVLAFLGIVIFCNIVKGACFMLTLYITKKDPPLCTSGDMIQSFLKEPDVFITGRCLLSKRDMERNSPEWTPRSANTGDIWTGGRDSWLAAVNRWQLVSFVVSLAILTTAAGLLIMLQGPMDRPSGLESFSMPFIGDSATGWKIPETRVFASFLLINIPQILVSYIYMGLNNILTTMLVMAEWCGYSAASRKPRKGLRVSSPLPKTQQRSTYFLSVPYRWSIPTTTIIAAVHFLVSEGVSFMQIDVQSSGWNASSTTHTTNFLFISTITVAVIILPVLGISLIVLIALILLRSYTSYMPLAGCCSASIAAACQPSRLPHDMLGRKTMFPADLAEKNLKWGVVEAPNRAEFGIGHATFSGDDVTPLEEEKMYT
ncbi:hypothetical protein N7456_004444 [Penicillium angulare]|uniref:DUF6536 domain-containing protein n=1 Tax=Penicillium angulare TaxID=116970 RepID=A0A9W9FWK4_9EURO|nr:hypothetical protein N7456_004444 [Penicillium angulare]